MSAHMTSIESVSGGVNKKRKKSPLEVSMIQVGGTDVTSPKATDNLPRLKVFAPQSQNISEFDIARSKYLTHRRPIKAPLRLKTRLSPHQQPKMHLQGRNLHSVMLPKIQPDNTDLQIFKDPTSPQMHSVGI